MVRTKLTAPRKGRDPKNARKTANSEFLNRPSILDSTASKNSSDRSKDITPKMVYSPTGARVFSIPELTQLILSFVPIESLIHLQRVSRSFFTFSKKGLFLEPERAHPLTAKNPTQEYRFNPLLLKHFAAFFIPDKPYAVRNPITRFLDQYNAVAQHKIFLYSNASWRRMLVCQPPVYQLSLVLDAFMRGFYSGWMDFSIPKVQNDRVQKLVEQCAGTQKDAGLRMGHLYDIVFLIMGNHDCSAGCFVYWNDLLNHRPRPSLHPYGEFPLSTERPTRQSNCRKHIREEELENEASIRESGEDNTPPLYTQPHVCIMAQGHPMVKEEEWPGHPVFYCKRGSDGEAGGSWQRLPVLWSTLKWPHAMNRDLRNEDFNFCGCEWLPGHRALKQLLWTRRNKELGIETEIVEAETNNIIAETANINAESANVNNGTGATLDQPLQEDGE